jgi:hypothetical protein
VLPLHFSDHAIQRMSQRRISPSDIEYVMRYGEKIYRAGMAHFYLGRRHIPLNDRANDRINNLVGITILIESGTLSEVVTVYRNRRGTKKIRSKAKFNLKTY